MKEYHRILSIYCYGKHIKYISINREHLEHRIYMLIEMLCLAIINSMVARVLEYEIASNIRQFAAGIH